MKLAIKSASAAAEVTDCTALTSSAGVCGSSCSTSRAWLRRLRSRAATSLVVDFDFRDALHPGREKREAVEKIQNAVALLALTDRVMPAVRAGDIAQETGLGAHMVEVDRYWIVDGGVTLQDQSDRPAEPHCRLRSQHRALTAESDRQHRAREKNEVARWNED